MSSRITTAGQVCSDEIRDLLTQAAYHMLQRQQGRETFCTEQYHGVIETDFQVAIDAGVAGIQFYVLVQGKKGVIEFSFLIRGEEALRCRRIYYSTPGCN